MFEVQVEDCLQRGDASRLVSLLHYEGLTRSALIRLDQLVTKELCRCGFSRVAVVLKSLGILLKNKDDLQTLIGHGLTVKVLLWFEAVCNLLTSDLKRSSAPLLSLAEEFFDYFLLLGQASLPVGQLSVVLLQLVQLTLQTEIHFPLRLEAIRTFNNVLMALSQEQKQLIRNDHNHNQILPQVAAAVLTAGDYELQVSLSEALCRMTLRRDRQQKANEWFSNPDISDAFCDIRDVDFELDCRRFLNFANRYHGDKRRVFTFPCLRAFLSSTQLFCPKDEKLAEFWIDFNVGSGSVSFFIDEPQGFLWGSIHVLKEDVDHYTLQLKQDETVLSVWLNNPIMHYNVRGQTVELTFNYKHHEELEEAAGRVFMKVQNTPDVKDPGGAVQASTSANKRSRRSYGRKKPSKSQLKILPLSSPSSEEGSPVSKPAARSTAEVLFDEVRHSTSTDHCFSPSSDITVESHLPDTKQPVSGDPEGLELQLSQEFGESSSPLEQDMFRKRKASDTGYLSDQSVAVLVHRRRVEEGGFSPSSDITVESHLPDTKQPVSGDPEGLELQLSQEFGESSSPLEQDMFRKRKASDTGYLSDQSVAVLVHRRRVEEGGGSVTGCSPEEAGLSAEEESPPVVTETPVSELGIGPESDLTSDIKAAFKTLRAQLEEHFTGHWQKVEAEILCSLKECQQHVSALLTAVHQHRLLLLQKLESSISDQVKQLEEDSSNLNSLSTQIQSFFRSEMQQLSSFCDQQLQRLKSLEGGEAGKERPSAD